jgi:hypothetical protein
MAAHETRLRQTSPALAAAFRDGARLPPIYPPIAGLIAGRDGTVWIEQPGTQDRRTYFVVDAAGEPLGGIDLPRNSMVAAADREHIWVLERDENDVQSVVRYRVAW